MKIMTTLSYSKKTKTYNLELTSTLVAKFRSMRWAERVRDILSNPAELSRTTFSCDRPVKKGRAGYRLFINGSNTCALSKTSYNSIKQYIKEIESDEFSNKSESNPIPPRAFGQSHRENPVQQEGGLRAESILCTLAKYEPAVSSQPEQGDQHVQGVSAFVRQLEAIDASLKIREGSDCELERGIAELQRSQLETAFKMRAIGEGQERIREGIEHCKNIAYNWIYKERETTQQTGDNGEYFIARAKSLDEQLLSLKNSLTDEQRELAIHYFGEI